MLLGLTGFVSLGILTSNSWAAPVNELAVNELAVNELAVNGKETETASPRLGIPGRRVSGGTRQDSIFASQYDAIVALTASDNISTTTAADPALLFYIPEMTASQTAEFVLRDSHDTLVAEMTFPISRKAGLVSLAMSDIPDAPTLNLNESYTWYFSIIPDADDRANDVVVHGSIRRIEGKSQGLGSELAHANLTWHDAVQTLAQRYQVEPNNAAIATEWTQLLESAGLTKFVQLSFAPVQAGFN